MTSETFSDRIVQLTEAISCQFPEVIDRDNRVAMVATILWNGEEYPEHNRALGDKASADRVREFLEAVEAVREAAENMVTQAAVPVLGIGRVNVAAVALHNLGSLVSYDEDRGSAACIERGRGRIATELNDPFRGQFADIADDLESTLRDYPVQQGREDVHRREMICELLDLFCFLRLGATNPSFQLNRKGEAIGAFPTFYRKIEDRLPDRLRFATADSRKAALGSALKGVLSTKDIT